MNRGKAGALIALALTAATAGCGAAAGGDKDGGPVGGPVVVRMATTSSGLDDIPPVGEFVRRAGTLSGGTLRITMTNQWGDYAPGAEARLVRAVAAGTVDLGWAGSRVFDTLGIRSWQALSAPMLIDSYALENAVLRSGMPGRMLAGLPKIGVAGLGCSGNGSACRSARTGRCWPRWIGAVSRSAPTSRASRNKRSGP